MALDPVLNFGKVTVSTGYDAAATEIVLTEGHGAKLPQPSVDGAFNMAWYNSTDHSDPADDANVEIVRVTARTTDTLTVARAQEGTAATVKNVADKTYKMVLGITKKMKDDIWTGIDGKAAIAQTMHIGTTEVAINRASEALTLVGITLTTPDLGTPSAIVLTNASGTVTNLTLVTPALGTPASGTLTSCTGLPLTGLVNDTTTALGVGTLELGHASDTTLARSAAGVLAVEGVVIPSISSTNTLTNKRITPRVGTVASSATPTPAGDTTDRYTVTALEEAATFGAPTGTPTDGQTLTIRIKDNGIARALAWNAIYEALEFALPTTTIAGKRLYCGFIYDSAATKWSLLAVNIEPAA